MNTITMPTFAYEDRLSATATRKAEAHAQLMYKDADMQRTEAARMYYKLMREYLEENPCRAQQ